MPWLSRLRRVPRHPVGIILLACAAVIPSAFADVSCEHHIDNNWGSGAVISIHIINNGVTTLNDWEVTFAPNYQITNSWNCELTGNNPYTLRPLAWNSTLPPGSIVECGLQVDNISGGLGNLPLTGPTCESSGSSSSSSWSSSSSSDTSSSVSSSSSSVSSSSQSSSSSASSEPLAPIEGGCEGYATRFWDCCKPHCGWSGNLPGGMAPMPSCGANNQLLSNPDAVSSCEGGDAYTCHGLAPFAVSEQLSYGYAATSSGDVCGRCFQIEFTGPSNMAPGDPGAQALAGKQMIVQAINIGHDVAGGQIDIMIPGGGVGAFDGCSSQWGVSNQELGAQYGGFLSACKDELGYNASASQYKSCVANRCDSVFGSRGLTDLHEGCRWFADWFEAADNPALRYREVPCPEALANASGLDRSDLGDIDQQCP